MRMAMSIDRPVDQGGAEGHRPAPERQAETPQRDPGDRSARLAEAVLFGAWVWTTS